MCPSTSVGYLFNTIHTYKLIVRHMVIIAAVGNPGMDIEILSIVGGGGIVNDDKK